MTVVGDNQPFDLIIYCNGIFYKIQVKTTEKIIGGSHMKFGLNRTNPFTKERFLYNKDEVDYFALYCIENNWCGLLPYRENIRELNVRLKQTKNNQTKNIIFATDVDFDIQIKKIWGLDKISNNIIHDEILTNSRIQKRKTKICPICKNKQIKLTSKTCRECYLKSFK